VSIVIPAYDRTDSLCEVLTSLARQDYSRDMYDVVIAAFRLPEHEAGRISHATSGLSNTVVEVPGSSWNVSHARNIGISSSTGDIVLLLDADIVVQPSFLREHVRCHSSNACAVAGSVTSFAPYLEKGVEATSWSHVNNQEDEGNAREHTFDARWNIIDRFRADAATDSAAGTEPPAIDGGRIPLPWAFFWSGNVSIRRDLVHAYGLLFDDSFEGWGAEDMEWGFRIWQAGVKMLFNKRANGLHRPHERNVAENVASEKANLCRLIRKHPCLAVEVVARYNDIEGNLRFDGICANLQQVFGHTADGIDCFMAIENDGKTSRATIGVSSDQIRCYSHHQTYQMLGIATWFATKELDEVQILKEARQLPPWLYEEVLREAHRVGKSVVR